MERGFQSCLRRRRYDPYVDLVHLEAGDKDSLSSWFITTESSKRRHAFEIFADVLSPSWSAIDSTRPSGPFTKLQLRNKGGTEFKTYNDSGEEPSL